MSRSPSRSSPSVVRPSSGTGSKLAAATAERIVDDVIAQEWPVGTVLGSEGELLDRYGVSRAIFREAVRLVEQQQVARMRRGPGGGLVVTEPSVDAIIDAAVLYLYRVGSRLDEVFEARLVLEEIVSELAPDRLDEADLLRMREHVTGEDEGRIVDPRAFHALLASITRNPVLELFVDIMNRVTLLYFSDRKAVGVDTATASHRAHAAIADAVLAGDEALARRRMRKHLEAEADFLRRRRYVRQVFPTQALGAPESSKRAEALARQIVQQVVLSGDQPGELIGSEGDLMERYGVSRAIFREAVRMLEHHHVAAMRRGPGGGLYVVPPDPAAVTEIVALYLARQGNDVRPLGDLRTRLEVVLVSLAMAKLDDAGVQRLHESLAAEHDVPDEDFARASHGLHAVIAALAGNRALELIALVLIRLTRLHQMTNLSTRARSRIRDEVRATHAGIVAAMVDGDTELARHRMRRHLEGLTEFYA